ncbi:hypothetical protein PSTT_15557 [Puccinia striiformis]|uniref:Uncharacterized protein n=1 Tax=Puccinia striiformis TaxID=27350 RepID=A0A2S4UH32_9BASI|nr:hypothetical protein PSTT_15557 [Puccinia striiformis]
MACRAITAVFCNSNVPADRLRQDTPWGCCYRLHSARDLRQQPIVPKPLIGKIDQPELILNRFGNPATVVKALKADSS